MSEIKTYENSVQHGVIDSMKRESKIMALKAGSSRAIHIVTAQAQNAPEEDPSNAAAEHVEAKVNAARQEMVSAAGGAIKKQIRQKLAPQKSDGVVTAAVKRSAAGPNRSLYVSRGHIPAGTRYQLQPMGRNKAGNQEGTLHGFVQSRTQNQVKKAWKGKSTMAQAMRPTSGAVNTASKVASEAAKAGKVIGTTAVQVGKTAGSAALGGATAGVSIAVEKSVGVAVDVGKKLNQSAQAGVQQLQQNQQENNTASNSAWRSGEGAQGLYDGNALTKFVAIALFFVLALVLLFTGGWLSQGGTGKAKNLSEQVESYRPIVIRYAEKYKIPEYTEVILALIMGETGGEPGYPNDPMGSAESGYNTKYPMVPGGIQDPEYSFDCGIHTLADSIKKAECKSPTDLNRLYKATIWGRGTSTTAMHITMVSGAVRALWRSAIT